MNDQLGINNIIRIPTSLNGDFFRYWFLFLEPFHNLTPREIDVITAFVKHRFELSKVIQDEDLLDKVLMGDDIKSKIRKDLNIKSPHFQIILSKLRKAKVIVDNKINPKFIPKKLNTKDKSFTLLLYFDLDEQSN